MSMDISEIVGWGSVLSVAEEGTDKLCAAASDASGKSFSTVEELASADVIGEYFPADKITSVTFAGEEVDTSEGIFVANMDLGSEYANEKFQDYGEIMEALFYEHWIDEPSVGEYIIELID